MTRRTENKAFAREPDDADWIARPEESWLRVLSPLRSVIKGVVFPYREQHSYTMM